MKNLFLLLLLSIAVSSCEKPTPDTIPYYIDMSYRLPTLNNARWDDSYESCLRYAKYYNGGYVDIVTSSNTIMVSSFDKYWIYNFSDSKLKSITFGMDNRSAWTLTQLANGAIKIIEGHGVNYYIYNESFVAAYYDVVAFEDEPDGVKMATTCHCFPKTKANLQAWGLTYALSL